jgi:predicted ribosomally synthesized peptide with SipW-like signal peptide
MLKPILMSLIVIGLVGALVAGGLFAHFSDQEQSSSTFSADVWFKNLQIDVNGEWYDDEGQPGGPGGVPTNDLPFELFGTNDNMKPCCDGGEERLSIHVKDMFTDEEELFLLLKDIDGEGPYSSIEHDCIEPEGEAGDPDYNNHNDPEGELDEFLWMEFWLDDGINPPTEIWKGYPSELTYDPELDGYQIPNTPVLFDPQEEYWVIVKWHFNQLENVNIAMSDSFHCILVIAINGYPDP